MKRRFILRSLCALLVVLSALSGCKTNGPGLRDEILPSISGGQDSMAKYQTMSVDINPSKENDFLTGEDLGNDIPPAPQSFDQMPPNYSPMTLANAIRLGIQNSKIIRDLGGNALRNPDSMRSIFDPAIVYTDPQRGEEAALSAFDARFFSQIFFEKNDRTVNNQFLATDGILIQDLGEIRTGFSKRAANGGLFTVQTIQEYDFNNSIGNRFGNPSSSWSNLIQGEVRQPLLRGSQVMFNRIAGPNNDDGVFNGVLIAKTRTDISAADFKTAVRNFIADVENSYWDLYYAYRDLEAKKMARDNALESWRRIKALGNEKKAGGEADKEGQAREQYFRFEAEVNDALYGRVTDATRNGNGAAAGTFRPVPGVRIAERRLRLLIGLPANGNELIRPSDEPSVAPVAFDWNSAVSEALTSREEIFRQLQQVKQARMQMLAAKTAIMPQLDFVGRYSIRGFGKDLIGDSDLSPSSSAVENMFDNENHEWQLGMDFNVPIGFRQAQAALRNNQNRLARERQLLREQKRQIINDLSDAFQDVERARKSYELQYNRLDSALAQYAAVQETNLQKKSPFNLVLEAQRRVLDAQIQFYRTQVEYTLAIRNVHFEKGSLFEYAAVRFVGENLVDQNGFDAELGLQNILSSNHPMDSANYVMADSQNPLAVQSDWQAVSAPAEIEGSGSFLEPTNGPPASSDGWTAPVPSNQTPLSDGESGTPDSFLDPTKTTDPTMPWKEKIRDVIPEVDIPEPSIESLDSTRLDPTSPTINKRPSSGFRFSDRSFPNAEIIAASFGDDLPEKKTAQKDFYADGAIVRSLADDSAEVNSESETKLVPIDLNLSDDSSK